MSMSVEDKTGDYCIIIDYPNTNTNTGLVTVHNNQMYDKCLVIASKFVDVFIFKVKIIQKYFPLTDVYQFIEHV